MEFASANFVFFFLPVVFLLHLVLPWKRVRNGLLIAASLVFYAWGEPVYVLLMLLSAVFNYELALLINGAKSGKTKKALLVFSLAVNIGVLAALKYAAFAVETFCGIFALSISVPQTPSPLGISFFTFQAISYIADTYRASVKPTKSFPRFLLYISFFGQLVQGPIIRYSSIEKQLDQRSLTAESIAEGFRLFIIGLGMKLVIANTLGRVSAQVFSMDASLLNAAYAWVGAICFLFQIYFDFAGYSKMAVGIGRAFGFTIPENFDYPYVSCSVTEFWRRWHMTLSAWFRDYVYIPLGGNRKGAFRTGVNKIIVFLLTGLWHGANWTYVVWGAYNGAFLLAENYTKNRFLKLPRLFKWLLTAIAVTVGFVIFNSPDIGYALSMIKSMFTGFKIHSGTAAELSVLMKPTVAATLAVAAVSATPLAALALKKLEKHSRLTAIIRYGSALLLLIVCILYIANGNYNPSIYTKF